MMQFPLFSLLGSLAALAAVVALILLAARLLRATGLAPKTSGRIAQQAVLALDARRRLVLVRAGAQEFLLLTGGANDVLIGEIKPEQP